MRSYGEYCAIAKSLDALGDRWTLLLVRELALRGPSRYTDLRAGLPGIASNLLADRIRELEQAGVIAREEAPPPIATTLYRLTPRGEELRPLLDELFRWGLPLMVEQAPDDAVRSHWLAGALDRMLVDRRSDLKPITLEIRVGDDPIVVESRKGVVAVRVGTAEDPDTTLTGPPGAVMGLLLGMLGITAAESEGVKLEGDRAVIHRLSTESRPTVATS
jgi:DNA-binding HxlR family transcriptional regulator